MNDIKSLTDKGKQFLRQYLEDQGVTFTKKGNNDWMCCIHPDHDDKNPSCAFVPESEDTYIKCFSCGMAADIYAAASFLEDKPLQGLGFIKENLEYILTKYSVEYEPIEFTDEQLSNFKYDNVYECVYKLMTMLDKDSHDFVHNDITPAVKRGWNRDICKSLGVGSIRNFDKFLNDLSKSTRIPESELKTMGIRDDLFGPGYITFCIRDYHGIVKGVVARYLSWTEGSTIPKYKNTAIGDNPFYHKDKLLYCLDLAKKMGSMRLDIFEGYGSAVTAQQESYRNCVALGGTALTDSHVEIIRHLGFQHINLVLDQDSTGQDNMEKYIEKFSGYNGLKVTTMNLPLTEEDRKIKGQNDPDFYIRKYGISEYRKLKPVGVFEHLIKKHAPVLDSEQNPGFTNNFAKSMIKLVINEPDQIERGQMVNTLAKYTKIDKEDIKSEIARLEANDTEKMKDDLLKNLKRVRSTDDIQTILSKTLTHIETSSSTKKDRHLVSVTETVEFMDDVFSEMNAH
ncbi:MAG: toprim domain-containing protein, partial [Alphaproteobacteria bacterium]|nr:toprim domain-containing protein [Alphaproteobacteria bacterium]